MMIKRETAYWSTQESSGSCQFFLSRDQDGVNKHKPSSKPSYFHLQILESKELGRYMVASRDLKAGDIIFKDEALVIGPKTITEPVCLGCYKRVDGSYRLVMHTKSWTVYL